MAGNEDIMVRVVSDITKIMKDFKNLEKQVKTTAQTIEKNLGKATNNLGTKMNSVGNHMVNTGQKIKSTMDGATAMGFIAAGTAATGFAKTCVDSAITAESEWTRFGALVNSGGGNWGEQEKSVKKWAKTFSNQYGFMVADTRSASASLLQAGVKADQLGASMNGVAALAARTGSTEEEAASTVISALNGKANALRKATGLEIENYKAADGSIDTQRLLTDIYNQNSEALEKHGNTTEGQMNKMKNSFNSFKSSIGEALLPVVKILASIVTTVADAFGKLPAPVKTVIAVLLVIGAAVGVVVGAIGMLAPILINVGSILVGISNAGSIFAYLFAEGSTLATLFPSLAATMSGVTISLTSLLWPILAVIAAFAALYYIGLKLGWWNDLGGMISKFGETLSWVAGQLMGFAKWFALLFTNFPEAMNQLKAWLNNIGPVVTEAVRALPDVVMGLLNSIWQDIMGVLGSIDWKLILIALNPIPTLIFNILSYIAPYVNQALTNALNEINKWGNDLMNSLSTAFNNSLQGIWNWGADLINGVNTALTNSVQGINEWGSNLMNSINTALNNAVSSVWQSAFNIGNNIRDGLNQSFAQLGNTFNIVVNNIRRYLAQARVIAGNLINQLRTAIINRIRQIPIQVGLQFMRIVQFIRTRLNQARAIASSLANNIRTAIINRIRAVVNGVHNLFHQVVSTIASTLSNAVSTAASKAQEIYNNIINHITSIPQKIGDEFNKIPEKIRTALANAASAALSGAKAIVDAVLGALHIASPGIIQRKVVGEFEDTASRISDSTPLAISNAANSAKGVVNAYMNNLKKLPTVDLGINSNALNTSNITSMMNNINKNLPSGSYGNVQNNTNTNNNKTIIFENVTLDCTNLTTQQARELFYKAVQGL